ncbi:UNKNOWN [Stylonychia lemnae]|uniref:Uncharacterized protein n=1 Tax=Stylonychia lemnae TaxID=5949 RepID=A0A078AEZ6_STYLE|nr:UNKNOWN [Stylonychia lemnae]|eukprot:CDW80092.1 UNKNOWN [Stylonychia lemnae]
MSATELLQNYQVPQQPSTSHQAFAPPSQSNSASFGPINDDFDFTAQLNQALQFNQSLQSQLLIPVEPLTNFQNMQPFANASFSFSSAQPSINLNEKQLSITLIIDMINQSEKFTFSYQECNNDLDILIDQICYLKSIDRTEDMRLVLVPDFIILDLDCIEDGDTVVLKNVQRVQSLGHYREQQSMQMVYDDPMRYLQEQHRVKRQYIRRQPQPGQYIPNEQHQNTLNDPSLATGATYIQNGKLRRRGKRGRPPKNGYSDENQPKNTYYFSIKQATSGAIPIDYNSLVDTPEFQDFNFLSQSRDELIHLFKTVAAKKGFKAIIPFTDRNNRMSTSTSFCCSLAGQSARKKSTNCPFKVTYTKNFADQYYKLENNFFSQHNHTLPIDEYLMNDNGQNQDGMQQEYVVKEQEQIIEKLMRKKKGLNGDSSQESSSSSSSSESDSQQSNKSGSGEGSKRKQKEKKKNKKKKKKSDKKDKHSSHKDHHNTSHSNFDSIRSQLSQNSQSSQEVLIFDE